MNVAIVDRSAFSVSGRLAQRTLFKKTNINLEDKQNGKEVLLSLH